VTWIRRVLVAGGVLALAYAVFGAVMSPDLRLNYLRFLALALIGHELILAPLAIGVGVLVGRLVPVQARAIVQAALFATAVLTVIALPALVGAGRSRDLPSALPRDYPRGLLILLALVWVCALAALVVRQVRSRRSA
jgi:hypothetical protein